MASWDSTLGSGCKVGDDDSDPCLLLGMWGPFDYRTLGRWGKMQAGKCMPAKNLSWQLSHCLSLSSPWSVTGQKKRVNLGHWSDVLVKYLKTDSVGGEPSFAAFSNFCGINIPTVANFKLPTWHQLIS